MKLFVHELKAQQRLFWRNREAAFFSFLFPILLLVLLGSVYGDEPIEGVRASTYLVAGLLGYGIAATAFAGLAITLVVRREAGLLKRVRGTPLSATVYIAAVIASEVIVIALQAIAQIGIGRYVLDARYPESPGAFTAVLLLGAGCFAAMGIGITSLVRSAEGSSAVVNAIYLPMAFTSGAFFSTQSMPGILEALSEILPLTHLLRLIRSTFVEGAGLASEPAALVALLAWGLVGLFFAVRRFKWEPREV